MSLSNYKLELADVDQTIEFDCGHKDLNDFFCNDALPFQEELLSKTYKYVDLNHNIIAMFSVSNDHISLSSSNKRHTYPEAKHLRYYPAVKIGRLGVNASMKRKGLGSEIINFLKVFFLVRNKTGCRYITVDAYNNTETINFYKKNGFILYTTEDGKKETRTMYFDLLPFYKGLRSVKKFEEIEKVIDTILNS